MKLLVNGSPNKKESELIDQIVNLLKEHKIIKDIFKEYGVDIEEIHNIPIEFKRLDVSAKAKDGKIYLNENLLEDGNFVDDLHYLPHEMTHILQQMTNNVNDKHYSDDHYLDDPSEIEAFRNQIKFIDDYKGKDAADKYVDELLDFHDFEGIRRKKKRKELRGA